MKSVAIIGARGIPKNFVGTSGIESYVQQQLKVLAQTYNVICYVRSWIYGQRGKTYEGARIFPIPSINTLYLDTITYSLLASIHATITPTHIVWYHGIGPAFFSFIPRFLGKEVYTTIHSRDWERKKWNIISRYFLMLCEQIALLNSSKIFVVSKELQMYYSQRVDTPIVLKKYTFRPRKRVLSAQTLERYHLHKNEYVLFVGRFVPEKRLEWLVRASSQISIPIVFVGGGSHTDAYEQYIHRIAVGGNIRFTGYLFGREKDELISNCKIFVLPSQTEGYPISIVEALEFNKHCLIADYLRADFIDFHTITYFKRDSYVDFFTTLLRCIQR